MKNGSLSLLIFERIKGGLYSIIHLLFLWSSLTVSAHAATYTVNSTADSPLSSGMCNGSGTCTLRAAIQAANATTGVTDTINLPAGTYTLTIGGTNEDLGATGDLDITDSINITGNDSATTIIDGNNLDRVFHITQSGVTVNISKVTIKNGYLTGGNGGGLYNNGGTVNIADSVISDNRNIRTSSSNPVPSGGGLFNSGTMSLNGVTLSNNTVDINHIYTAGAGGGGGIYNTGVLRVENCTFDGNQVLNPELYDPPSSTNQIGTDGSGGGGIQNTGITGQGPNATHTVIVRSNFTNNVAPFGGGVRNQFGKVDIDLTEVDGNSAGLSGGGVQNADGTLSILRSTIRNNIAKQSGGGVDNLAVLSVSGSFIYNNQAVGINAGAGGAGGGLFNGGDGQIDLLNTTISGNTARAGGGIYNHKDMMVTNATIFDNKLIDSTGAPKTSPGTEVFACGTGNAENVSTCNTDITDANGNKLIQTNFINTIIGNSTTTDNCNGDVTDLIISKGNNIETTANTCGFTNTGDVNSASVASLFSNTLGYYGGDLASLWTLPISVSGPAYNVGNNTFCPSTDQRNLLRVDGACDIGAYEVGATATATNVLDLALDITYGVGSPLNGTVQTTITFAVANKGPLQGTNVTLTGSLPALSWLKITSLGSESSAGTCTATSTGFTCSIPSIDAYQSANFFVGVLATQAGSFTASGEVDSAEVDNYRPDNIKSVTINIPTVAGSSVSGNNFAGSSGGGSMDFLSIVILIPTMARRMRLRKKSP